jgi:ribose/xylose/arabinose/galactoside ABC-type transport system permease subunit
MGRYIFALGGNEEVSYISGVNVNTVRLAAYVLSGMFAAIAGIFMFSRSVAGDPTAGTALGMYVVAAVVVGGTKMSGGRGSVLFTIIGIFIIGSINNILNLINAPYQFQQIVQGIIIITAVVISSPRRR